nr:reverse transcriptase domain-containing protein [Tanacetum cinerariifolium]
MHFGLKNVGATYQRLVDKAFNSQVGQNIEVYVDDFVIKSHTKTEMLKNIDETFDESSCVDGSGAGLILASPEGTKLTYALRSQFTASKNEAKYERLIASLWITAPIGVRNVYVSVDSKLVANQVLRTYVAKEENMIK